MQIKFLSGPSQGGERAGKKSLQKAFFSVLQGQNKTTMSDKDIRIFSILFWVLCLKEMLGQKILPIV